jgi:hypothetical protein
VTGCAWTTAAVAVLTAAVSAQGLRGELQTIDGERRVGVLTVTAAGTATLTQDAAAVALTLDELVAFVVAGAAAAEVETPHRVWLRSGLQLPAVALRGRSGSADRPAAWLVELPAGVMVELPLGFVRAVRHGGSERPEPPRFAVDLAQPPDNDDVLFVQKNGQTHRSQVSITGLQADRLEFSLRDTAYEFPLAGVTAVVFGRNTGFAPDRQPRPRTSVQLTTGERLEGRLLELVTDLHLRLDEGVDVRVPLPALQRLEVASDRLVQLSDLQPKVEQTPAFDRVWPWCNDGTPAGPGLVLDGTVFARGIGMVPRTRLTYDLGGEYDAFAATIGIDDRGGPAAHAVFRVLVDGRVVFESPPKLRGEAPTAVQVELARCRELAIEVDFGKNYDLGDFCAWADARVVRR